MSKTLFPRVKEARELLRSKTVDLLNKYELIIDRAIARGDLEIAETATRWLLEHMPAEDGERLIDPSATKPPPPPPPPPAVLLPSGPTIQIGIALGGMAETKGLLPAAEVIDVTKVEAGK